MIKSRAMLLAGVSALAMLARVAEAEQFPANGGDNGGGGTGVASGASGYGGDGAGSRSGFGDPIEELARLLGEAQEREGQASL
jgi:hypothetical protein